MKKNIVALCVLAGTLLLALPTLGTERIAYFHGEWGDLNIYVISAAGGTPIQLTARAGNNLDPEWSADGTRIVFQSDRDGYAAIYVMNSDGSGQVRISPAGGQYRSPCWAPDGVSILCSGPEDVCVLDIRSGEMRILVPNAWGGWNAKVSADGSRIVFESDRDGDAEIYLGDWDGTAWTRLTDNAVDDQHPVLSPSGDLIAFNSSAPGRQDFDLFTMRIDGSDVRRVTDAPDHDEYASWSPDGTQLVYAYGNAALYIVNADGSGRRLLVAPGFWTAGPAWQPTGEAG